MNFEKINKHLSLVPESQQFCSTGSPNESWNLLRAQIIWAAVPINRGPRPYQALFSLRRGERRERERSLKTFHRMLFKQSVSNLGSKSNPCRENRLWYLTQKQRRCVIIEWLACWVNSSTISSHSYTERSWLSLKWHLGSGIWNAPDYQEVGNCVWREIGNHRRKLDKIQEWRSGFDKTFYYLFCSVIYVSCIVFAIAWVQHP